jgi:membrane associated rhomboid family serine protease
MFPLRDDNPTINTPYATYAIIALNVLVGALVQGFGSPQALAGSICTLGLIPGELLDLVPAGTRVPVGANMVCVLGDTTSWYTPLTSMFMHGGWLHIVVNMWFMWIFGNNVEDSMGTARFVAFYLLCGLAAAALQVFANPASSIPMVGASGAIGGVMGAYIVLFPRVKVHMLIFLGFLITTVAVPAVFMLAYWILVQFISGIGSYGSEGGGVAFWAHIGGFVGGALLIFLFKDPKLLRRHPYTGWRGQRSTSRSWHRIDRR